MDCENKCDSLFLIHGFPLQSDCKNRAFALLHRYAQRFTDQQGKGFLSTVFSPVDLTLEAPWVVAEALRNMGGCPWTEALQLHQGGVVPSDFPESPAGTARSS